MPQLPRSHVRLPALAGGSPLHRSACSHAHANESHGTHTQRPGHNQSHAIHPSGNRAQCPTLIVKYVLLALPGVN